MKVNVEKIDNHNRVLEIEIPQPEVAKALDKAYHKLAGQVNIPGFRKGKAPRHILEMRIGKEALLDEAFELLASKAYVKALDEQNIEPVSRPKIEVVALKEDQPLVFKVTVVAKPEITLGQYKDLKVAQSVEEITEEQVSAELKTMQNRQAKMVVVEDAVLQNGDFAIIDFEGFIDGTPFQGGEGKAYPLELGSGTFIPGFEEQLIGAKASEEREVNVTFPEDYHAAELAGKPVVFKVKIQDVKRKELPELDDDFAKDVSKFETLEELKQDIKNRLEKAAEEKAEQEFNNGAIKQAVENSTVDVPDVMVEDRISNMIEELNIRLQNRGMEIEKYLQYINSDMDTLRQNYRAAALFNVKTDLMLDAVAKTEGLEVKPEDMEKEIAAMSQAYQTKPEEVAKIIAEQGRLGSLAATVLRKKAADLIIESAVKE